MAILSTTVQYSFCPAQRPRDSNILTASLVGHVYQVRQYPKEELKCHVNVGNDPVPNPR
jgi:hypothetical protein